MVKELQKRRNRLRIPCEEQLENEIIVAHSTTIDSSASWFLVLD